MSDPLIQFIRQWYGTDDYIPLHAPTFGRADRDYVLDAIDSTFVSSVGEYVSRFEKQLAACTGAGRAVAMVNGTAALQVALRLVGSQAGSEVITQPLTFIATANAIAHTGAKPVFLDVDRRTLGLSPEALESFLNEHAERRDDGAYNKTTNRRIAAVVPMHTFGHPCRIEEICRIAEAWGIAVVEDAAESLGSTSGGKYCGTFGLLGIYSFNGNKTITCGAGGAIVTNDDALADRAKHLTTTAKVPHRWEYVHDEIGYNFRMPNLNAAMACAQLEKLESYIADKRLLAEAYAEFFSKIDGVSFVTEPAGCRSNYWLNTVIFPDSARRDAFLKRTNDAGIMTRPAWKLMNELAMYRDCQCGPLEQAEWLEQRIVNIPSSPRADSAT
ncbi:MAG: LegC family aminotransferase [Phycisphaerae bacterium]|nr:LegC family aminotransferase [Phycisphaerae bacterium]